MIRKSWSAGSGAPGTLRDAAPPGKRPSMTLGGAASLAALLGFGPMAMAQEVPGTSAPYYPGAGGPAYYSGAMAPKADGLRRTYYQDPAATPPTSPLGEAPAFPSLPDASTPAAEGSAPGALPPGYPPGFRPGEAPKPTESDIDAPEAEQEAEGDVPLLTKMLGLEDSPIKIYGWIQNTITGNANGNGAGQTNFGVNPNYKAGEWMGNQYYFVVTKPIVQDDTVNFGFRVDSLFGNDWAFNHMVGLLDNAFVPGRFSGYDPAQFYGEVHLPMLFEKGVDVKFGRWYTIDGYEVVPAVDRPMISVPYMFNYGQPFTHWGLLTTSNISDRFKVFNGAINGWDRFQNENYHWGYIGGFNWTSEDEKTNLVSTFTYGPNQFPTFLAANTALFPAGTTPPPFKAGQPNPGYADNWRGLFTTVLTHKWTDKFTQVIETDQGWEPNVPNLGVNGRSKDATWFSFGNWFFYDFNDKLQGIWRSEVFWDPQGARVVFGEGDRYYEMTLSMRYKPTSYLWIQPEVRYDWSQFSSPYDNGTKDSQFTYGIQAILLF